MTDKTLLGVGVLGAALALGVLGDALLRATPWGLSVVLATGALATALALLLRWRRLPVAADGGWLMAAALVFAAGYAWRDSPTLRLLNTLALLAALALALAALRTWPGQVRVATLTDYALTVVYAFVHAVGGSVPLLFQEIRWRQLPGGRWYALALAAARGVLIAIPVVLVFGALFVAADPVFERLVAGLFDWDLGEVFDHALGTAVCAWLAAGLLRGVLLEPDGARAARAAAATGVRASGRSLGVVEIGVALGLVDALFLAFVLVQVRYLFGGAAQVSPATGLTYAEYARRGFFELVAVTALALPLLLLAHSFLRRGGPAGERTAERVYGVLAGTLVALLFVVMASAVQRMRLYQEVYGLTELRLYTTAFMGWLALVFAWFGATVLRGQRKRFAFGALVSGFAAVAALNALNPDALIVRTNARHPNAAHAFDVDYLTSLSADAAPALVEALPLVPEGRRRLMAERLLHRWSAPPKSDWRTWNYGRAAAWHAVAGHHVALRHAAAHPP